MDTSAVIHFLKKRSINRSLIVFFKEKIQPTAFLFGTWRSSYRIRVTKERLTWKVSVWPFEYVTINKFRGVTAFVKISTNAVTITSRHSYANKVSEKVG